MLTAWWRTRLLWIVIVPSKCPKNQREANDDQNQGPGRIPVEIAEIEQQKKHPQAEQNDAAGHAAFLLMRFLSVRILGHNGVTRELRRISI